MSSEDYSEGEKFCCSDSASPRSNPMLINVNDSLNEPKSCTKEALLVEHSNVNGQLLEQISILWVIHQVLLVHETSMHVGVTILVVDRTRSMM